MSYRYFLCLFFVSSFQCSFSYSSYFYDLLLPSMSSSSFLLWNDIGFHFQQRLLSQSSVVLYSDRTIHTTSFYKWKISQRTGTLGSTTKFLVKDFSFIVVLSITGKEKELLKLLYIFLFLNLIAITFFLPLCYIDSIKSIKLGFMRKKDQKVVRIEIYNV